MSPRNRRSLSGAAAHDAVVAEAVVLLLILFFTKNIKYCIISLTGTAVGIAGFIILARQADRILNKGKGKTMYFISSLAKLLVIAVLSFIVSRLPGPGILFFIQGLMMIYMGITFAGLRQAARGNRHGA